MIDFFFTVLSNLVVAPAAVLCLAPMKNQLRYSKKIILIGMTAVFGILVPVCAFLQLRFSLDANVVLLPMLVLFFIAYHLCLKVNISKSIGIFAYVCAIMSVFANTSNGIDALINPDANALIVTHENAVLQFAISSVGALLLFYPMHKYGSFLIDNLNIDRIWYVTVLISGTVLAVNISMVPQNYQTLYTNNVFRIFWELQIMFFFIEIVLAIIFYFIVEGLLNSARNEARTRLLEAQESSYLKQQHYIEETARARHDFKQTVRTLAALAADNDIDAIRDYLVRYAETLPENDVQHYCKNNAVNALLNHYAQAAEENNIRISWEINLPEDICISNTDLCITIGNILDNAMTACVQAKERYIKLTVRVHNGSNLYIIAVNSFSGKVRQKGGRYLSTNRNGSGIGLSSVKTIAEKNGGTARFHHEGNEFFSEVVMNVTKNENSI
ncbi:MAG: sensor histidine kinase [Ruminiclostridium sp.]|nr:sensor histidine kinase [Ruminiclostridium sp.]